MEGLARQHPARNDLLIALATVPLAVAAIGRYGLKVAAMIAISVVVGLAVEVVACKLRRRPVGALGYPAWVLLALVLPPALPLWMVGVAAFFATGIAIGYFGGHGRQLASAVAVGWAFGALSFPTAFGFSWAYPFPGFLGGFTRWTAALPTIDHPIELLELRTPVAVRDVLLGAFPQSPANALPALTLAVGAILAALRAIDVRTSMAFMATTAALMAVGRLAAPQAVPPLVTLLVGDFPIAALLVLGDRRTSARTTAGRWVAGAMGGLVAFIVRGFSSFADGVFFAVLFTNTFSAIVDEAVLRLRSRAAGARP